MATSGNKENEDLKDSQPVIRYRRDIARPAKWELDVPPSIAGTRKRHYFRTEKEARFELARIKAASASAGIAGVTAGNGLTIGEAIAIWRDATDSGLSAASLRQRDTVCRRFKSAFGQSSPDAIAPLEVDRWLSRLPVSNTTRKGHYTILHVLFRWAERKGLCARNVITRVDVPRIDEPERLILTPGQMKNALSVPHLPFEARAVLVLGGFCGLRSVEIERLDWSAVNWETGEIHISREVAKQVRKFNRERYAPLTDTARRWLPECPRTGRVSTLGRRAVEHWRGLICEAMGVKEWPHNALRHSFGTYMLAHTGDARRLTEWMGHSSAEVTRRHYARPCPKATAKAWWDL